MSSRVLQPECNNLEECERKFMSKLDYYKFTLRGFLVGLSMVSVFVVSIVLASYNIGNKIGTLKVQVDSMDKKVEKVDEKVDKILDDRILDDTKKIEKNADNKIDSKSEILDPVDIGIILNSKNPALSAVCKK